MKTSLGPKGLDKMVIDEDADIVITNDGATILDNMDVDHEVAKLLVQLAKSQDQDVGDGTTSVVVLAGALLEQAESLIKKGIHPIRIADGFELAATHCIKHLDTISEEFAFDADNLEPLVQVAMTALGSKIVKKEGRKLAEIAVKAVTNVADIKNKEANLNWIRVITKSGKNLENTMLINGVTMDRSFLHLQTPETWENAKVALLTFDLEMPKVEHKIKLELGGVGDYHSMQLYEDKVISDMVKNIKEAGTDIVVCFKAIDPEICHALFQNGIGAIQRVIAPEMDALAKATGAKMIPIPSMLSAKDLGIAGSVKHKNLGGTVVEDMIVFEKCQNANISTILIRGSNPSALDEAKRSMTDALMVIQNMIKDNRVVYGGGAAEISCALAVTEEADKLSSMEQYSFRAFADALEFIPAALAGNSGYDPIQTLTEVKILQLTEGSSIYGVDCVGAGTCDMKKQHVVDTLLSKKNQIILASQMVKMILKIDQIRVDDKYYGRYDSNMYQNSNNI